MAKQHQDSVWPYIYSGRSLNNNGFKMTIYNKGIGPALIKSVSINVDGTNYNSWQSLLNQYDLDTLTFYCSNISGTIISPQEEHTIFGLTKSTEALLVWNKIPNINVDIIYCSIHDECWNSNGSQIKKINSYESINGICK
ncbi:hypothetical protein [uncultured Psychroserpens sp.]|uniref:hypothetical protein n=1 Tax=uncultured Psychroserpens sp. TaxID=255436 RepID=UPI00261903F0|nr:hypothetical protein [uncultured Psychroserpens sp.]